MKTRRYLKKSSSVIDDILEDSQPRPKSAKKIYEKPQNPTEIPDDDWSDEEKDWNSNVISLPKQTPVSSDHQVLRVAEKKEIQKVYNGEVKVRRGDEYELSEIERKEAEEEKEFQFDIPLPYVAPHVTEILGIRTIKLLWREFLLHDTDETELILLEHLPEIFERVQNEIDSYIPFDQIKYTSADEYTDFQYVVHHLATALNRPGALPIPSPERVLLPPCCALKSCQLHSRINEKYSSGTEKRSNFRLDVIYRRYISEKNGNVRVSHIPAMMTEAEIPYNLNPIEMNMPSNYWILNGDKLILSYEQLFETVQLIRTDIDSDLSLDTIYKLPKWLKNEFTPNEVLLFRHHFMMIDIDCGGTIDAHELQLLGESLGNAISEEEAEKIIAEHDTDGEGSLNFEEFMTLMFQILRGTIDIQTDVLAKTMMESRNQIKIFQEIEEIKSLIAAKPMSGDQENSFMESLQCDSHTTSVSTLSSYVRVLHYGGIPVECDYQITGPANTPYAGGKYVINVIYSNGYPFQSPICICKTRILHINFIPLINGCYSLPHLEFMWDSSWTTKELIEHIYELLVSPNPRYLSDDFIAVYNSYLLENYEIEDEESMLLTSVFSTYQKPTGGESDLYESQEKTKSYRELLQRMPRMRQYHLNLIVKCLLDPESYDDMARQAREKFAMKNHAKDEEESLIINNSSIVD